MVATWEDPTLVQSDEAVFFLKKSGIARNTYNIFLGAGYTSWMLQSGSGGISSTNEQDWERLGIPPGEREKLSELFQHYRDMTFPEHYNLPRGNMDGGENVRVKVGDDTIWDKIMANFPLCLIIVFLVLPVLVAAGWQVLFGTTTVAAVAAVAAPAVTVADCVDGKTKVLTAGRRQVSISSLKQGDHVLSFDQGKYQVRKVLHVWEHEVPVSKMVRIVFHGADDILATENHSFWVRGKDWCSYHPAQQTTLKTKQLAIGDAVVTANGKVVKVAATERMQPSSVNEQRKVFNLILDGPGTFFVNGMLCHSGLKLVMDDKLHVMSKVV